MRNNASGYAMSVMTWAIGAEVVISSSMRMATVPLVVTITCMRVAGNAMGATLGVRVRSIAPIADLIRLMLKPMRKTNVRGRKSHLKNTMREERIAGAMRGHVMLANIDYALKTGTHNKKTKEAKCLRSPFFLCLYSIMTQLLNGDCLEVLKTLADSSVDLVITDLPYGQTNCNWDVIIDMTKLWEQLLRVGKNNTAYIFFCTTRFGYSIIESNKKMFRYDLVWEKPNSGCGFLNAKKMPKRSHEMIYVFYDKLPTYNIEDNHVKLSESVYSKKEKIDSAGVYADSIVYSSFKISNGKRLYEPSLPKSIISCNVNNKKKHPTEKPQGIMEWLIKYYSKRGDVVLDPTMGSGSTGVACKTLGRAFIGIELNKEYFDIATAQISPPII